MSVTHLPHSGEHVQIDTGGVQTIFGWSARDEAIRPPAPDEGYPNDSAGWTLYRQWIVASVAALVTAYNASHSEDDPRVRTVRVSPEVAAHLRAAKDVYGRPALFRYKVAETEAGPVVRIPLSEGSQWYKEGGVRRLEISPHCEGIQLLDKDYNVLDK